MKNIFYKIIAISGILGLTGCQKDEPQDINFDVSASKTEIIAGDSITFNFEGNADIISFYSGEKGKEYRYRNRTVIEGSGLELTISTRVLNGSQENNLKLMYSKTFSGVYNKENIKEEDWIDLTSRFTLSTAPGNNQVAPGNTVSGPIDISDIVEKDKPIYFALRYESAAAASNALGGKTYRIPVFDLNDVSAEGTRSSLATIRNINFTSIPIINTADDVTNKFKIFSSGADYFLQYVPNVRSQAHLHWGVSPAFIPGSVSPDKAKPIKAFLDKMQPSFNHKFMTPGTYVVTFVAKNVNSNGSKEVVREVEITVK